MADKLLKVCNGSAWYEKLVRPSNGSGYYDKVVKVCNGTTWYTNYPRQAYYTQEFPCTWTQSYQGDGVALYNGTFWEHDLVVGDDENFRALIGFDKNKIQTFINGGTVTKLLLLINLKETSLNGNPDVYFGKYSYTSEPASYTGQGDWGDQKHFQFPNKKYGGYWITLNPTQATMADQTTAIGCICMKGATANVEDMARFNGITTYTSKLQIEVYK